MKQKGIVIQTENQYAWVTVPRMSACGENCVSCGGSCRKSGHVAQVANPLGATVGDAVMVSTTDSAIFRSILLVYLCPVLLLFIAYGIAFSITQNAAFATAISLLALAGSFCLLKLLDKKLAPLPEITAILETNITGRNDSHGI